MALEKFYSVIAEMEDGKKSVPVRGDSPSGVFQQVKAMPGVRRVGKVAEIDRATYDALVHGRPVPSDAPGGKGRQRHAPGRAAGPAPAPDRTPEDRRAAMGHAMTGPRVVTHVKATGGEQPFKHLQAPPERPKPPKPVVHHHKKVEPGPPDLKARPAPQPAPAERVGAEAPAAAATTVGREYRIVKSRRRDGLPYLLQRGCWLDQAGKRVFDVEWEKGFGEREQAETHLGWVERNERELAEVNPQA